MNRQLGGKVCLGFPDRPKLKPPDPRLFSLPKKKSKKKKKRR